MSTADNDIRQFREIMHDQTASRLARIEVFKAVFLVIAFIAIGFAAGFHVATTRCSVPPVWSAWI